uniref:Chemokine interleukin-8-like domain-containing protein n=1 Tax=Cyprinodon variegatus TaxID=28743 RepID=A0A3Q2E0A2_CYPVA
MIWIIVRFFVLFTASCCMRYTRGKIPCKALTGYNIQTINVTAHSCACSSLCSSFHLGGRFVCADPLKAWTLRAMKCVDEKRRKVERILEERN